MLPDGPYYRLPAELGGAVITAIDPPADPAWLSDYVAGVTAGHPGWVILVHRAALTLAPAPDRGADTAGRTQRTLEDWLDRALLAVELDDDEPWPAWSAGEILAVALILRDARPGRSARMLAAEDYTEDQAVNRLRYDLGQTTEQAEASFQRLRDAVALARQPRLRPTAAELLHRLGKPVADQLGRSTMVQPDPDEEG